MSEPWQAAPLPIHHRSEQARTETEAVKYYLKSSADSPFAPAGLPCPGAGACRPGNTRTMHGLNTRQDILHSLALIRCAPFYIRPASGKRAVLTGRICARGQVSA